MDKLHTRTKKRAENAILAAKTKRRRQTQQTTDAFTLLCRSYLHVECVKEYRFHPTRKWRFDYAIPTHRIALEVEGGVWTAGRHTRPKGFIEDCNKYNQAALYGWRLFRCTPSDLMTRKTLDLLKSAINGDFLPKNDEKTT